MYKLIKSSKLCKKGFKKILFARPSKRQNLNLNLFVLLEWRRPKDKPM